MNLGPNIMNIWISWQSLKLKQYERFWRPSVLCHKLLICSDLHVLTQHNNSRHQNNYEPSMDVYVDIWSSATFSIRKDLAEGPYRGWWTLLESSRRRYSTDIYFWVRKFEQKTHLDNNSNNWWYIAYAFICHFRGKKTLLNLLLKISMSDLF